jgi:3-oxoacyl-[acyl-carrier-protein] synthase II
MGEEASGVSALRIAAARIAAGQSTHALVGGAYNGEDADFLLVLQLAGLLSKDGWAPVLARDAGGAKGGVITGSGAAFLVIEQRAHAEARGAKPLAVLGQVAEGRARRADPGAAAAIAETLAAAAGGTAPDMIFSGASGAAPALALERAALALLPEGMNAAPVSAWGSRTGHLREPHFIAGVALAALCVAEGAAPAPLEGETPPAGAPGRILVEIIGPIRAEGAVMVETAEAGA